MLRLLVDAGSGSISEAVDSASGKILVDVTRLRLTASGEDD